MALLGRMQHLSPIILPGQGVCSRFESRLYTSLDTHATDGMRQCVREHANPGCDQPSAPPEKICTPKKVCTTENAVVSRPLLPKLVANKSWCVCFHSKAMEIPGESSPPGHPNRTRHQNKAT